MAGKEDLIKRFQEITGSDVSTERAQFFIESAGGDLSTALSSFYEESGAEGEIPVLNPTSNDGGNSSVEGASGVTPKINFASMEQESDEDSDDEGQAFYAGGGRNSGQQVIGPNKKKKDIVSKLFKAAKENGAEVVSQENSGKKVKKATFKGTSYRLGETENDTQVFQDPSASQEVRALPVELRMWSNGFSVDDGPLRKYEDPENMMFLSQLKAGVIPKELLKQAKGKEVSINMSDRHHEEYIPPKKVVKAFTGTGQALGSPAPSLTGESSRAATAPAASASDIKSLEEAAKQKLALDSSQPTTNIQVRLADGSRLVMRVNHTHTVGDLRTYLVTARPSYAAAEFALMTTFPHAELMDSNATVKDANLLNSAIVAKIK